MSVQKQVQVILDEQKMKTVAEKVEAMIQIHEKIKGRPATKEERAMFTEKITGELQ